ARRRRPLATEAADPRQGRSLLLASLPAGALERVVHGGERDLQVLGQRGRALPALDLLAEIHRLVVGELEGPSSLPGHSVGAPAPAPGPSAGDPAAVEELSGLLDDALKLVLQHRVLIHQASDCVLEVLERTANRGHPVGDSWHGRAPYTELENGRKRNT